MKQTIKQEQLKAMRELKSEGLGIYAIAKRLNLTYAKVAYYIGDYKQRNLCVIK
jgi:predicted transcriptional regulator